MRKTFFKELSELAKTDDRIWLLTADLLCYQELFPKDRFINVGIAEQNMIGIASGLAMCGKIPFCYSMSTFLIFRAYEFIRNDVAHQNLPVRLVGCIGPYEDYGISHNCPDDEDLKVIRLLDNFTLGFNDLRDYKEPHPIYYRLSR